MRPGFRFLEVGRNFILVNSTRIYNGKFFFLQTQNKSILVIPGEAPGGECEGNDFPK